MKTRVGHLGGKDSNSGDEVCRWGEGRTWRAERQPAAAGLEAEPQERPGGGAEKPARDSCAAASSQPLPADT